MGQPEVQPATPRDEEIRERALQLINGAAPDSLKIRPVKPRSEQLEIEIAAIDTVLVALAQKDRVARAAEAELFVAQHRNEWTQLCADILLVATRLQALERKAIAWRGQLSAIPSSLPLAEYFGTGRSILGPTIVWPGDPLSRPREAALQANIVTAKEIKAAQNE